MRLAAHAKINLYLDILRRRPDGYHDLRTMFQTVGLADEVEALPRRDGGEDRLRVEGPFAAGVPEDGRNLVLKAVARLRSTLAPGRGCGALDIRLSKRVPHGGGLGGGSSDAAAALRLAWHVWTDGSPADEALLHATACAIGCDCAFFLTGGTALGEGRGDVLTPLVRRRPLPLLLVFPEFNVPTPEAYRALDPTDLGPRSDHDGLVAWLGGASDAVPLLENTFERAIGARHPEMGTILAALRRSGAVAARLSGSGSTCFGIYADEGSVPAALDGPWRVVRTGAA